MFCRWMLIPAALAVTLFAAGCGPSPAPDSVETATVLSEPAAKPSAAPYDPTNGLTSNVGIARRDDAEVPWLAAATPQPVARPTPAHAGNYIQALVFDVTQSNFGQLKSTAGLQTATFTAVNRSDRRVRIVDTNKSCGCLLNKVSTMDMLPGEPLQVVLQLNPAGRSGNTTHNFTIKTDEPGPLYFLTLSGNVEYVPGSQAQYVYVNSLVRGTTQRVSTVVESASTRLSEATFELTQPNLLLSNPAVDGATLSFDLSTISTAARGKVRADLIVRDPKTDEVLATVPLLVVIDDNIAFNTPSLFLGRMIPGQEIRKEVQVVVHNGTLPAIRSVRLEQSTREQATAQLIPGSHPPTIEVLVHPAAIQTQVFRDTLRVELEDGGQPEAVLPVVGLVARQDEQ